MRDARVMPGHDAVEAQHARPFIELAELQIPVAVDARVGRPAGFIAAHKLLNHLLPKLRLKVENIKRDAELIGDGARVLDVVQRAAGLRAGKSCVLVGVQLHHAAGAGIPGIDHQLSGNAAVHAAAHGDQCLHGSILSIRAPPGFL